MIARMSDIPYVLVILGLLLAIYVQHSHDTPKRAMCWVDRRRVEEFDLSVVFAYITKHNKICIIHPRCDSRVFTREGIIGGALMKMEQLVWHEVLFDRAKYCIRAISRDVCRPRIEILLEYLPRDLAKFVIDYAFKRLRKTK